MVSVYFIVAGSIDKLPPHLSTTDLQHKGNVIFIAKKAENVKTCDKSTQTDDKSYTLALKRGVSNEFS